MFKEVVGALFGIAATAIGSLASAAEIDCDYRDDHSSRCNQVRDLSAATKADDCVPKGAVKE